MKFHSTAPVLGLKWARQAGEKTLDTSKTDPKAFKAALISAAAEEQPAVKTECAKKRSSDIAQKPKEQQKEKTTGADPDGKKQGNSENAKTAAAFYPAELTGTINNARQTVKTVAKTQTAAVQAETYKSKEIKAEASTPARTGAVNFGTTAAKERTPAGQETPAVKQENAGSKQEAAGSKQEATGSKQGEPITSISVTSSKPKDDGAGPDDNGRDGQNIFRPAQQMPVDNEKKAAMPDMINANTATPAKEVIKDITAQLKASFYKAPEIGVEYTAVIKLSPPSLGSMEIKTVLKPDQTISVKITATNNDTISMLTAKLDTLKQELSGVFAGSPGQLDVNVGTQGQDPRNSGAGQESRGEEHIYQDGVYSHSSGQAVRQAAYVEKNSYMV
jgi:hypothetical protein